MAKDIKAIKCPHCGSVYKQELKPEFYKCQNCGTEYYLDSDDIHIHHHHEPVAPVQSSSPPISSNTPLYILVFGVACIIIAYLVVVMFSSTKSSGNKNYVIQMPKIGFAWYLYTNAQTGDPVYLRLYADYISRGSDKQEYQIHAQYNNAATGELLHDRRMFKDVVTRSNYSFSFRTYPGNLIYAICDNTRLFQLDASSNQLMEVTSTLFKDYPQLSSGIAKLEFAYEKAVINIVSNEGNTLFYLPVSRQLLTDAAQVQESENKRLKSRHFVFDNPENVVGISNKQELHEVGYFEEAHQMLYRNFTPGRTYFDPKIVYQDANNLLIASRITAADEAPLSIQAIDNKNRKVLWALPPDNYDVYTSTKCKQGFAVEYRKGEEADYVHGAIVISKSGKLVHDFQLKRTE
jgi:hypothetical protein